MGTRGAVARTTEEGWTGRYHHRDSYPTGLGEWLWTALHEQFDGDVEAMLEVLVDEHPAGWSTVVGRDLRLAAGYDGEHGACEVCGEAKWRHETDDGEAWKRGHEYEPPVPEGQPQCYCHGDRSEEEWEVTHENASGSGVEYAYVFDVAERKMAVMESYIGPGYPEHMGEKMVGAFGVGDPDALWQPTVVLDLDGPEPRWERVECGPEYERCRHVAWFHFPHLRGQGQLAGEKLRTLKWLEVEELSPHDAAGVRDAEGQLWEFTGNEQRSETVRRREAKRPVPGVEERRWFQFDGRTHEPQEEGVELVMPATVSGDPEVDRAEALSGRVQ